MPIPNSVVGVRYRPRHPGADVRNPHDQLVATYRLPLPSDSATSGVTFRIDEERIGDASIECQPALDERASVQLGQARDVRLESSPYPTAIS